MESGSRRAPDKLAGSGTCQQTRRILRQTLANQVYEYLQEAILLAELRAGERLNEVELAKRLGVSATPVREAINKLKGDGVVKTDPWRGCYVRDFSLQDISNVFETRFALETLALNQGIPQMSSADMANLDRIEQDYERAYEADPVDRVQAAASNARFHQFPALVAKNEWLVLLMNNLDVFLHVVRAPLTRASTGHPSIEEHNAMIEATRRRDVATAVERLREHVYRLRDEAVRAHDAAQDQ